MGCIYILKPNKFIALTKFHIINKFYFILLYTYLWYRFLFIHPIIVAILFNYLIFENNSTPLKCQIINFVNSYIIAATFISLRSIVKKSSYILEELHHQRKQIYLKNNPPPHLVVQYSYNIKLR